MKLFPITIPSEPNTRIFRCRLYVDRDHRQTNLLPKRYRNTIDSSWPHVAWNTDIWYAYTWLGLWICIETTQ